LWSRSVWRRVRLALNIASLAISVALIGGAIWAWLGERGWPAPALVLGLYNPILAALRWYSAGPIGIKALCALLSLLGVIVLLGCLVFSFKVHLEEIAVMLLGIPFYLSVACSCFLAAGLAVSLVRLLFSLLS
jgi:hypothetical protein